MDTDEKQRWHRLKYNIETVIILILQEALAITLVLNIYAYWPDICAFAKQLNPEYNEMYSLLVMEKDNKQCNRGRRIVSQAMLSVPDSVIDKIQDEKWVIKITDSPVSDYIRNNNWQVASFVNKDKTVGITQFQDKTVIINVESIDSLQYVTLHELAHVYDFYCRDQSDVQVSQTDEFIEIYNSEKSWAQEYAQNSQGEYFAYSMAHYWSNPKQLETNAERTYNYLKELNSLDIS